MADNIYCNISEILKKHKEKIISLWVNQVRGEGKKLVNILTEREIYKITEELLSGFISGIESGDSLNCPGYDALKYQLKAFIEEMTMKNLPPSETALLIFSMKDAIFPTFQSSFEGEDLYKVLLLTNDIIDKLGLLSFDHYLQAKEKLITEQQNIMLELSVPVVTVWDKILLVPLIGMVDSRRTQLMMEKLLAAIENSQAKIAILDISGIPIVDTLVARHLIVTISAAKLMGSECIMTGISSKTAQTIVNLGVDLTGVVTRITIADGLKYAVEKTG
jgi:rsbT co-antagonist protein RsbR